MIRHWFFIFNLLLLFFVSVDAGHPAWESMPRVKRSIPIDLGSQTVTTWPGGRVPYCWENLEARANFVVDMRIALNLWYAAGLPERRFRFNEIPYEDCMRDRRNSLVIHAGPGSLEYASTVGKYVGPTTPDTPGPMAIFPTKPDRVGTRAEGNTVIEKIAHELGHIWGLFHEHQDPYFWEGRSLFQLACNNLEGFDQAAHGLSEDEIYGPHGICKDRLAAFARGFQTATHFLPMHELWYVPHLPRHPEMGDVDWNSIMLYGSHVGLKLDKISHVKVLTKRLDGFPDGVRIHLKRAPSQGDVQGLIQLYDASENRPLERLYHDPRSEYHTAFDRLRNFQACQGPPLRR